MVEDLAHDEGVGEQCDELAAPAAVRAGEHVDGEDALEQLGRVSIRARQGTGNAAIARPGYTGVPQAVDRMLLLCTALWSLQAARSGDSQGPARTFDSSVMWIAHAPRVGAFGFPITPVGDLNDDGSVDLMVGAPLDWNVGNVPGSLSFVDSRTGRIFETYVQPKQHLQRGAGDIFPLDASAVGDVDGDGVQDAMVAIGDLSILVTRLYLVSGRERSIIAEYSYQSGISMSGLLCGLGDTDCDGIGEWVACSRDSRGGLMKLAGVQADIVGRGPARFRPSDAPWLVDSPHCLVDVRDVDGDGVRDVLFGGPCVEAPAAWYCLYSGRDLSFLRALQGSGNLRESWAGRSVVYGDEVVVSTHDADSVTFHALSLDGIHGRCIATLDLEHLERSRDFTIVGDLDGDGLGDLVLARSDAVVPRLQVISGADGSLLGEIRDLPAISADHPTRVGYSLVCIGDAGGENGMEIALQLCAGEEYGEDERFAVCAIRLTPRAR